MWLKSTAMAAAAISILTASVAAAPPIDERLVTKALGELRTAISRDDRAAVAAMIEYPINVLAGGMRIPMPTAADLIRNYDVVFSPSLKAVIAQAAVATAGRPSPAYRINITGTVATVAGDLLWLQPVGTSLKITRITEPLTPPAATVADAPAKPSRAPRRLTLSVGQTQLSGTLSAGGRDSYIVAAAKNQLIDVRINRVNARDIVVHIVDLKTQAPLDARARDGVRVWTGRVPAEADYRIDVVRLAPAGEPQLPYVLVISMR
jgi:hypothetical protein